jgi:hypothetical protein
MTPSAFESATNTALGVLKVNVKDLVALHQLLSHSFERHPGLARLGLSEYRVNLSSIEQALTVGAVEHCGPRLCLVLIELDDSWKPAGVGLWCWYCLELWVWHRLGLRLQPRTDINRLQVTAPARAEALGFESRRGL